MDWMKRGNCHNLQLEMFFPSDGVGVLRAQRICADCPVRDICLEYALEAKIEHGVWGGTSERQRQRLRRNLQPAAQAS